MQTKNFKGQDLRGRSFKNQDLTAADFSDCDLRGVDFSFANLTDAKFCNARMGKTLKAGFYLMILQLLLGVFAGFIATAGNVLVVRVFEQLLNALSINSDVNQIIFMIVYMLLFTSVVLFAVNKKRLDYAMLNFISTITKGIFKI